MTYQIYRLHLNDGKSIDIAEDYHLPFENGIIEQVKNANDNEWLTVDDGIAGIFYIPVKSILYISAAEVRNVPD